MRKRMFLASFAVLALIATATMVMAQPGGGQGRPGGQGGQGGPGGPGGPGGGMMMGGTAMGVLFNEEARTALGITQDQMEKLQEAGQALFANMPRPQQGQAPDMAQMREQMQKIQAEGRKNLESILSADQVTKMDVMVFQSSGGLNPPAQTAGGPGSMGFGMGGMVGVESLRALNLTEDQKKKVQEAQDKMMEAMRPQGGMPDFQNMTQEERQAFGARMQEAGQKARGEFYAAVKGTLTDAQKAKAEELMKDVPQYLQRPAPGQGGNRPGGNLNNFRPGEGAPGTNPNREQRQQRGGAGGGRQFPG
ncbi:MAG: Spy/CpxP family protein refolding chaperone [Planctomycetaceae bacterium]|nr:Spy/CpxP family protein refolding chaperone [Planctomycetaceae bacterium]